MDIADDRLSAGMHGDMLNADSLLTLTAQPGERFDLSGECPLQLDCQITVELEVIRTIGALRPAQHGHRKGMAANHLGCEGALELILGIDRPEHCQRRIQAEHVRLAARRRASRRHLKRVHLLEHERGGCGA
ncbi:hypothetical protein [Sphingomonas sp. IC-56]|uniref:hypothetical protein n=1 Tax=Sphingomonas sp. IC-56 TaxID=2898529 RepID=UPI003FA7BC64